MEAVLIVYKEVNTGNHKEQESYIISLSVDEKPRVPAIKNTASDLAPKAGKSKTWSRDYEYKRLGTVSILAALDLHDGHVNAQVHKMHRSRQFICLLKEIDSYYPPP
jgi:hypothetical protein